ncbi:hypothetical protein B1A99_24960 [Cohnella sp. CIP 111063]|uniref:hypothetical protein n=1 Tax=unclassified Cohnella TaxID=2636738 RepID=UPI000B8C671B|nr:MULTISPECIES: hypothetical protein [unclassified Cohnella]OXS55033.1 hypothetical protein B1A99_24960 [Cohnella sp. CIP 111063]PRX65167.1 hypothetical protein B0G52_118120 [Cohnella sp. SGD-V74]
MSSFFSLSYNELDDYLCMLSNVIMVKKMMEFGFSVDPSWKVGDPIQSYFLKALFGESIQENMDKFVLTGPLSRKDIHDLRALLKSHAFSDEWTETEFKVNKLGVQFEFSTHYPKLHLMFEDFVELAKLWNESIMTRKVKRYARDERKKNKVNIG